MNAGRVERAPFPSDRADYDSAVIELRELTDGEQEIAERFWQLFLHDLSEFRDSYPNEHGAFKRRNLEPYLVEDGDRVAFLVHGPTGPVGSRSSTAWPARCAGSTSSSSSAPGAVQVSAGLRQRRRPSVSRTLGGRVPEREPHRGAVLAPPGGGGGQRRSRAASAGP